MTGLAIDPAVHGALRAALALLFTWAASHKLRDWVGFRATVENYELLPGRWVGVGAGLVIAAELGIAAGLCLSGAAAALVAAGLLAVYTGAIGVNLTRGRRDIDCGCGGAASRQPLSLELVVRNGVLAAMAVVSAVPAAARPLTWIDTLTIAASVATMTLLYAAVDRLLANAPRAERAGAPSPAKRGRAGEGAASNSTVGDHRGPLPNPPPLRRGGEDDATAHAQEVAHA